MEVSFVVPPFFPGTTEHLTVEWSEPFIPAPGDTIDIHYYVRKDVYEKLYKLIVTDYPEITPWEAQYIGKSIGYVFDNEDVQVESRYWVGEGVMLTCKFSGYCKDNK